jgi:starch phosphorylase
MKKAAYLCAEFAISPALPTFAGGLGVLAADTLYQASDLDLPIIGVTLFYAAGCFNQWLDEEGNPQEQCIRIDPRRAGIVDTGVMVDVPLPGRTVFLKVWKKEVGNTVFYLLDPDVPENGTRDRSLAERLYDGRGQPSRIESGFLMGVGAVRALRELGEEISLWHINDDHASFSILERIRKLISEGKSLAKAQEEIKKRTVYTTHTPSLGAESTFRLEEVRPLLKSFFKGSFTDELCALGEREKDGERCFSLTVFAMRLSRAVNAVSRAHQKVARGLWKFISRKPKITYVTNGIYPKRWVANPMNALYKKYLAPDWDRRADDPAVWGRVRDIPDDIFWKARQEAKEKLAEEVHRRSGEEIDPSALILGFARRLVSYKQPTLLFEDRERLAAILCNSKRPAYLLMSGKVQPHGDVNLVKTISSAVKDPLFEDRFIFLENYNLDLARLLVSGSDVWLNTPVPGQEACGTSGMKALYNGVLHASTPDGWWVEAFNGKNGWEINGSTGSPQGSPDGVRAEPGRSADSLYTLLEKEIVPLYYERKDGTPEAWVKKVKGAVADLAPRYNTARMLKEYKEKVYAP